MYAHLFNRPKSALTKFELLITREPSLHDIVERFQCDTKREARKVAVEHNAQPWNF